MNRITTIFLGLLFVGAITSCGSDANSEKEAEVIQDLESVNDDLNRTIEEVEAETEDMNHDVDSLLEGI